MIPADPFSGILNLGMSVFAGITGQRTAETFRRGAEMIYYTEKERTQQELAYGAAAFESAKAARAALENPDVQARLASFKAPKDMAKPTDTSDVLKRFAALAALLALALILKGSFT